MSSRESSENESTPQRTSIITKLASTAAKFWKVTAALWVIIIALGVYSYTVGLPREGFPPVNVPIAVATATYFVDDAELVDADIASPLGEAFGGIDSAESVQSLAYPNQAIFIVEFAQDITSPEGAALLQQVVDAVDLPEAAELQVQPVDAAKFLEDYDVLMTVSGPDDATAEDLQAQAAKLAAVLEEAPGVIRAEGRDLLTEAVNPTNGEPEIRQTHFVRAFFDGTDGFEEAITVGVVRDPNTDLDILEFSDGINEALDNQDVLSDGYQAAVTADFANNVRTQVNSLIANLLTGLAAVALVSMLIISWRVALVTSLFMATVTLAALAGLWLLGYTLNTITLFGLILTLGLLVDDAIVISESLDANRDEPMDGFEDHSLGVVNTAVQQVGTASLAGTLTTVLVFAPLMFIGGILGEFIRAIPVTVIVTLLTSYVFSVLFIPAIGKSFLLKGGRPNNPIARGERAISAAAGRLAEYPSSHGVKGLAVGAVLIAFAFMTLASAATIAGTLGFNIFPPGDDADAIFVEGNFAPGTEIEDAQATARTIDTIVSDVLGDDLVTAQYIFGNTNELTIYAEITPFNDRDTKAPVFIEAMNAQLAQIPGVRVSARPLENGPPVEEFPFAAQIQVEGQDPTQAQAFAEQLRDQLEGADLDKGTGKATTITGSIVNTDGYVFRIDGDRVIEVRAAFSTDDLTNNLDATEVLVGELYDDAALADLDLTSDDIVFDYGLESDNQEDFASLGGALMIALGLMFVLLVVQFRSIVQPLLVFLAIPFSFLGVTIALKVTDNPISFFSAVGFIALLGVVVNNSILLIDAANQARRDGLRPGLAIGRAVERRFRPLVATTITTVVGLLPLALSDPFWESLAFTLIGGLVSSTIIVVLAFPVFYLIVEKFRTPIRNLARRKLGWKQV